MRCTRRQLNFEIECNNSYKIGMNTIANKLFSISKMISLGMLHLTFVHCKKLAKIQFLKYGQTWYMTPPPPHHKGRFWLSIHDTGWCLKIVWIVPYLRYTLYVTYGWCITDRQNLRLGWFYFNLYWPTLGILYVPE